MLGQLQGQDPKTWKGTTRDLREHVCAIWLSSAQYFSRSAPETKCASKRLNRFRRSEPKVGQSWYTPKGTTRPSRGVVCKIWRQSDKYFQRYAPETNCSRTAKRPNAVTSSFSPLQPCVLNSDLKYFNLSIIHLEVTHIPKIVILAYFLTKL